jgi:hypothetical protein
MLNLRRNEMGASMTDVNDTILDDATCLIERSSVRGIIMQSQDIDVAQKALLLGEIDALPISTPRDWKSPDCDEPPHVSKVWNDRTKDWHPPHNTKPLPSGYGSEGER